MYLYSLQSPLNGVFMDLTKAQSALNELQNQITILQQRCINLAIERDEWRAKCDAQTVVKKDTEPANAH